MRWLVEQYYKSAAFQEIGDDYQKTRRGILDRFCEKHGTKRYEHLQPKHLRMIRDDMIDRPGAANNLLKALRQVFKYAVNYGYLNANPVAVVERLKSKNKDGFHAWSIDEVRKFEARHPIGSKARLAFALLLYTAQRRSDVVVMGKQHVKDGWMDVNQQKTKKKISIPILDELQEVIDASPVGDLTFLVTAHNRPFTSNGFGNWFRKRCDEAGLPQCSAHGLRKAAAAHLAEIGCSSHEIMAITGHESISEVQRYTKTAQQKFLAEQVRKRIDG
jgi:integrase